jgi:ActR/RegA family two-component response regulator
MASLTKIAGKHILLVEDEYLIAQDIARSMVNAGAEVIGPAAAVQDALRLILGAPVLDGAVLDINLKGEMVYPVADALSTRGIPFVFATGYGQEAVPVRYGQVTRCEKPFNARQIAEALFG